METSSLIYIEAILMCLRSQSRIQIHAALLGVLIGLGVAGFLVMWMNEGVYMKQKSVMRYKAGERMFFTLVMALTWILPRMTLLKRGQMVSLEC